MDDEPINNNKKIITIISIFVILVLAYGIYMCKSEAAIFEKYHGSFSILTFFVSLRLTIL